MSTITRNALFGAGIYRYVAFASTLVLAMFLWSGALAAAEPTLKDVIKGAPKEKASEAKPKGEPKKESKDKPKPPQSGPVDELGRGVPRTTIQGFRKAANARDYERAAKYLDLRNLPGWMSQSQGPQLARHFKIVLDRGPLWVDLGEVSGDPKGRAGDGLPSYQDLLGSIKTPSRSVKILLQRVPRKEDGVMIWKLSSATVAAIPGLYEQYGFGAIGEILPEAIFDIDILGIQIWLWFGLLVVVVLAYLAALVITKVLIFLLRLTKARLGNRLERLVTGPVSLLIFAFLGKAGIELLGPSLILRAVLQTRTLFIIAIAWLVMRFFDLAAERVAVRLRQTGQSDAAVLLPPVRNTLKVVVIIIAAVVWLDNVGFQVTTLMAGLGLGGLALALGLQKTIENVVGAVTLYSAQPVRIGDFGQFGATMGTIEEIGLRATRVRTLDRTVVSIPNAEFSNLHLNNFSKRDKIWYHPKIRLRYDTTPDQVRYILVQAQKLLYSHPKVSSDSASIRFMELGTYSLDLEVFAYIAVTDYNEFKQVAEDLNLRIMDIVTEGGSHLALPAHTEFQESGVGPDEQRARAAEQEVQTWRTQNTLYLPKFPQEKITELSDTLDYPPKGSPLASAGT
jgi:MscS family membrane protein